MTFRKLVHLVSANNLDPYKAYTAEELAKYNFSAINSEEEQETMSIVISDVSEIGGSIVASKPEELIEVAPPTSESIEDAATIEVLETVSKQQKTKKVTTNTKNKTDKSKGVNLT